MNGITVDTWIKLERCSIEYALVDGEAEFQFGGIAEGLTVTATEAGLVNLIDKSTEALEALRAARAASTQ